MIYYMNSAKYLIRHRCDTITPLSWPEECSNTGLSNFFSGGPISEFKIVIEVLVQLVFVNNKKIVEKLSVLNFDHKISKNMSL